jgi:hypothetical protein
MSSNDISSRPKTFDGGSGFNKYVAKILSYAMLHSFADAYNESWAPAPPKDANAPTGNERKDLAAWRLMDQKARGLLLETVSQVIRAMLEHDFTVSTVAAERPTYVSMVSRQTGAPYSISVLLRGTPDKAKHKYSASAALMLTYLEQKYGKKGLIEAYTTFLKMTRVVCPPGRNPQPYLNQVTAAYQQLVALGVIMPDPTLALSYAAALPPSTNGLSKFLVSKSMALTGDEVAKFVQAEFNTSTTLRGGKEQRASTDTAHKISAVRTEPSDPLFSTQVHSQLRHPRAQNNHNQQRSAPASSSGPCPAHSSSAPSAPSGKGKGHGDHKRGSGGKGKGKSRDRAHVADDASSDGGFAAHAQEEPSSGTKSITPCDCERARAQAIEFGLDTSSKSIGQLARIIADGRRAQYKCACAKQDALQSKRASHNPYVETSVTAGIPSTLDEQPRIVSERKRAERSRPVPEAISSVGAEAHGLPVSLRTGSHRDACNRQELDDAVHLEPRAHSSPAPQPQLRETSRGYAGTEQAPSPPPRAPSPVKRSPQREPSPVTWCTIQAKHGAWDSEDKVLRCIDCFYELAEVEDGMGNACVGCGRHYSPEPDTSALSDASFYDGSSSEEDLDKAQRLEQLDLEREVGALRPDFSSDDNMGSDNESVEGGHYEGRTWVITDEPAKRKRKADVDVAPAVLKRRCPTPPGGPANAAGGSKRTAGVHQRARVWSLDQRDEYVHHYLEYALVADSSPVSKHTRIEDQESVHAHLCVHDNDFAACIRCKGKNRAGHQTPWLLDSGASKHFTNNLDDYVDYNAWSPSEQESLTTATSTAKMHQQNRKALVLWFGLVVLVAKKSMVQTRIF